MNRKQAEQALAKLDTLRASNPRERRRMARTADRLRRIAKPKPEPWDWSLPF